MDCSKCMIEHGEILIVSRGCHLHVKRSITREGSAMSGRAMVAGSEQIGLGMPDLDTVVVAKSFSANNAEDPMFLGSSAGWGFRTVFKPLPLFFPRMTWRLMNLRVSASTSCLPVDTMNGRDTACIP